ncbi:unnamed protein product [Prunus brigantina]
MEEGSPGVFLKDYRVPKRSRASDVGGMDSEMMSEPNMAVPPSADTVLPKWASGSESFRDKLMNKVNLVRNVGIDVNTLEAEYEGLNDDEDVTISRGDRGPCIQFSDRAMDRLCKPWQNALIIKLLGRSHTYNYLHARLQQKWSLIGGWKLVDLVNDYFVVRFELEEDLNFVLTGGPWIIAGQYLVMQKWRPGFCPATEKITRMAAWIRVSAIQLECFDLLKIDALTTSQNRGKFARLCVELDLSRPLEAFVQINTVWYNVEYEGLPDICYLCGRYGHKREHCDVLFATSVEKTGDGSNLGDGSKLGDDGLIGGDTVMGKDGNAGIENLRGPWMNVPARRRPKGGTQEVGGKGGRNTGSRFDALRQEMGKVQATVGKVKETSYSKVGQLVNKSNMVYEGKKAGGIISLTEQLKIWTNGQDAYRATGVYHFGHQPPNIATNCADTEAEVDIDVDVDSLASPAQEGMNPAEKMNLAASHVDHPNGLCRMNLILFGSRSSFLASKSRLKWLQEGDRNTKFFHLTTIIRRRRNRIERLKDDKGVWVEDAAVADGDLASLVKNIDLLEVKDSLFGIGGLKAPGVDGFPACFYQHQWDLCASDIYAMVCEAFQKSRFPLELNATLITLVPKVVNPHSMVQFRPISLCCTLYKVISKILVSRLRTILPNLISPNQVSFVPGRHITDNIMIAQELMHKFKSAKGKKGMFAWKIDLSKAYDRLNWGFIESVLLEVGLPSSFIQLIMQCVSTVRYQICINGELTDPFSPSSGIRQWDPLSPYLFVLCIEKLSHIIVDAVKRRLWKPIKTSRNGPNVSHLFFADDLVLFAEATPCQARVMKDCLDLFCSASGQTKYLKGCSILDTHGVSKQDCSATWRSVLYGVELLKKGMVWRVGNGEHVKFWKDNWVADLPLLQYAGAQSGIDLDCKVSNFFKEGWWDIAKLRAVLDEVMVQKITCFPVGFGGNSQDAQIWKPTSNGIFTVKSAFQLIHGGSIWSNMCWKGLWSMSIPPKLKVFLWLVFQGKILTNEQRVRRHLAVESSCSVCGWHSETIIHTLRDCGRAKELNVDGTCMTASGKIGAGGVIRDCVGEWCAGFAVNLGKGRILDAEIWGLFFGLRLAVAKGFTKIIIEMDSRIACESFPAKGLSLFPSSSCFAFKLWADA